MSTIGATVSIKGEVQSAVDVTVAGRVEGPITCKGAAVTIAATAEVTGDIMARDVTVFGRVSGRMIATEVVDLRPECDVTGQVISAKFILHEGATFHGRVEPQHLEAALRVAKYQQQKDTATPAALTPP